MNRVIRHKQPTVKGGRKHTFVMRMEPGLRYQLSVLAERNGLSVAALMTDAVKAQWPEAQIETRPGAQQALKNQNAHLAG